MHPRLSFPPCAVANSIGLRWGIILRFTCTTHYPPPQGAFSATQLSASRALNSVRDLIFHHELPPA